MWGSGASHQTRRQGKGFFTWRSDYEITCETGDRRPAAWRRYDRSGRTRECRSWRFRRYRRTRLLRLLQQRTGLLWLRLLSPVLILSLQRLAGTGTLLQLL